MIYVSEDQLTQVNYLIHQSIQGNHILFDAETIRDVFSDSDADDTAPLRFPASSRDSASGDEPRLDEAYSVEHHLERMICEPSLPQKRAYLEKLDRATLHHVVRTYMLIIENNLREAGEVRH